MFSREKPVLVTTTRTDMRSILKDSLKELGFSESIAFSSIMEMVDHLKSTQAQPSWIFCDIQPEAEMDLLAFLTSKLRYEYLGATLVTALINGEEVEHTQTCYELGCVSHLQLPVTKTNITDDISRIIEKGELNNWNTTDIASQSLRSHYNKTEDFNSLLRLEKQLTQNFPLNSTYMIHLAEANLALENRVEARKILTKAMTLSGEVNAKAKELLDVVVSKTTEEEEKEFIESQKVEKSALIVDADTASCNSIQTALSEIAFGSIEIKHSAEEAIDFLSENPETQYLIMDWKLPKVSGLQLIQRINAIESCSPQIVVLAAGLTSDETLLVDEIGIAGSLPKPIIKNELQSLLQSHLLESKSNTNAEVAYQAFMKAIRSENSDEIKSTYNLYFAVEKRDPVTDLLVRGELDYYDEDYESAKIIAFEAFSKSGGKLAANSLVSKVLVKLKMSEEAIKMMTWATEKSPLNISRICQLAELQSESGSAEESKELLEKAQNIDAASPEVAETTARVSLNNGDTEGMKKALAGLPSLAPIVGYINNRGVLLVRKGDIEKGIQLYKDALEAIPDDRGTERAAVLYNLSLALAKSNDLKNSSSYLGKIKKSDSGRLFEKGQNLKKRVEDAIAKGKPLKFATNDSEEAVKSISLILRSYAKNTGQLALYGILYSDYLSSKDFQKVLKTAEKVELG